MLLITQSLPTPDKLLAPEKFRQTQILYFDVGAHLRAPDSSDSLLVFLVPSSATATQRCYGNPAIDTRSDAPRTSGPLGYLERVGRRVRRPRHQSPVLLANRRTGHRRSVQYAQRARHSVADHLDLDRRDL